MTYIILFIAITTICLTLFVTNFCLKYIQNLRQTILDLTKRNKHQEQKIISLNQYWKNFADAREQDFINKLQLFEISERDRILVNRFDENFLTIPCYGTGRPIDYENFVQQKHFQKGYFIQHLNIVDMDYEYIEQILSQNLAEYLIKEKFVKGKYEISNNHVKFIVSIMTQIT